MVFQVLHNLMSVHCFNSTEAITTNENTFSGRWGRYRLVLFADHDVHGCIEAEEVSQVD